MPSAATDAIGNTLCVELRPASFASGFLHDFELNPLNLREALTLSCDQVVKFFVQPRIFPHAPTPNN